MTPQRSRKALANGPTALYRFFDADGSLLYVGITSNTKKRWAYHASEQATTWWPLVASNTVQWLETRDEAERQEVVAIKTELPLHNVMHTARNRQPYGARRGTMTSASSTRGNQVLECIRERFSDVAFSQMDVLPHVPLCRSAVQKNFRALLIRGEISPVGRRSDGCRGGGHVLYALPDSQLARSGKSIQEVSELGRERKRRAAHVQGGASAWKKYGSPPGKTSFRIWQAAQDTYGACPFTRPTLAALTGLSMPGLLKHVISLEKHGFLRCVGRDAPVPGRSGHPPKLYVVTDMEPPALI